MNRTMLVAVGVALTIGVASGVLAQPRFPPPPPIHVLNPPGNSLTPNLGGNLTPTLKPTLPLPNVPEVKPNPVLGPGPAVPTPGPSRQTEPVDAPRKVPADWGTTSPPPASQESPTKPETEHRDAPPQDSRLIWWVGGGVLLAWWLLVRQRRVTAR